MSQRIWLPVLVVFVACVLFVSVRYLVVQDRLAFVDYDGYFSYYIARWGFNFEKTAPLMEMPTASYRYQRIVYPLVAYVLSFGRQEQVAPVLLVVLNVLAITGGTFFVARILDGMGTSSWYALVFGLYGSQFLGLLTSLSEPMMFLFVAMGIFFWTRGKLAACVAALAVATLTKELALLFVFAFVVYYLVQKRWQIAVLFSLAVVPFALWQIALWAMLGEPGFSGGYPFEPPLWGWLSGYAEYPNQFLLFGLVLIPMTYVPMLVLGVRASLDVLQKHLWHPYVLMVLVNVAFMLFLPRESAREPAAMVRITQGLVLATLLYGSLVKSKRILNYSVLWIATLVILVNGSVGGGEG